MMIIILLLLLLSRTAGGPGGSAHEVYGGGAEVEGEGAAELEVVDGDHRAPVHLGPRHGPAPRPPCGHRDETVTVTAMTISL